MIEKFFNAVHFKHTLIVITFFQFFTIPFQSFVPEGIVTGAIRER